MGNYDAMRGTFWGTRGRINIITLQLKEEKNGKKQYLLWFLGCDTQDSRFWFSCVQVVHLVRVFCCIAGSLQVDEGKVLLHLHFRKDHLS